MADKDIEVRRLRIDRVNPDNVRPVHANDILINHTEGEFFLTFSLIEPPSIIVQEDIDKLQGVEAITMAKIVVTPEFAEKILTALTKNIEFYKARKAQDVVEQ
jgi:hypothetical protein